MLLLTSSGVQAHGVALSIGTPAQKFAFLPSATYSDTWLYDADGQCSAQNTTAACATIRGGQYSEDSSSTYSASTVEAVVDTFANASKAKWATDTLGFNGSMDIAYYAFGTPDAATGPVGDAHSPQNTLGLAASSAFLHALNANSLITRLAWERLLGPAGDVLGRGIDARRLRPREDDGAELHAAAQLLERVSHGHVDAYQRCQHYQRWEHDEHLRGEDEGPCCLFGSRLERRARPALLAVLYQFRGRDGTANVGRSYGVNYGAMLYPSTTWRKRKRHAEDRSAILRSTVLMVDHEASTFTLWQGRYNASTGPRRDRRVRDREFAVEYCWRWWGRDPGAEAGGGSSTQAHTQAQTSATGAVSTGSVRSAPQTSETGTGSVSSTASASAANATDAGASSARKHRSSGLSGGAIAGIVIGAIAAVALVAGVVVLLLILRRRNNNNNNNRNASPVDEKDKEGVAMIPTANSAAGTNGSGSGSGSEHGSDVPFLSTSASEQGHIHGAGVTSPSRSEVAGSSATPTTTRTPHAEVDANDAEMREMGAGKGQGAWGGVGGVPVRHELSHDAEWRGHELSHETGWRGYEIGPGERERERVELDGTGVGEKPLGTNGRVL
ncbi:hypothetical protein MRB53_041795 [Persea americana]|nr:hypothetical protein MRB53_041795 [Persea americana]